MATPEEIDEIEEGLDDLEDADEIQAEAEARDDEHDATLAVLVAAVALLYRRYFSAVRSRVVEVSEQGKPFAPDAAQQVADELPALLEDAGLGDVLTRFGEELRRTVDTAMTAYGVFGVNATTAGVEMDVLAGMVSAAQAELSADIQRRLTTAVEQALTGASLADLTAQQVLAQLRDVEAGLSLKGVEGVVDDAIARIYRAAILSKGKSLGFDVFVFVGPLDERTCKICEKILTENRHGLPGVFYLDEIYELGLNPAIGGGHPRCRHMWLGVPPDRLRAAGFRFRE